MMINIRKIQRSQFSSRFPLLLLLLFGFFTAQSQKKQPNIIVILADDLGWADLSCYGSTFYETPNLDKLANQGIKFNRGYASCPVCSPTRASMITGKYPVKTGVTDWIRGRQADGKARVYEKLVSKPIADALALEEKTIAELAVENGYKTFFAGKWHLGEKEEFWPEAQGFQINMGGTNKGSPAGFINDSTGGFFTPYANPRLTDGPKGEYLSDRLTNETLQFIQQQKEKPFFIFYSLFAVHNPLQAPKKLIEKYKEKQREMGLVAANTFRKDEDWMKFENGWKQRTIQSNPVYAAMIENMDTNIGRILETLEQLGMDDNTIVLFTSDNGGLSTAEGSPTNNGPLRAGKGWLYEGGIRVPTIIRWPQKIKAGEISDIPVNTVDFYPTLAKAMNHNYKKAKSIDGEEILNLLTGSKSNNRAMFWHYPHYSNQGGKPGSAIMQNNFKLIVNYEDNKVELYDLQNDVHETNNLASANKMETDKLKRKLDEWLKRTAAKFPEPNPKYSEKISKPETGNDH